VFKVDEYVIGPEASAQIVAGDGGARFFQQSRQDQRLRLEPGLAPHAFEAHVVQS
jgi:hypothetical protein